jgi:hypothetical protein
MVKTIGAHRVTLGPGTMQNWWVITAPGRVIETRGKREAERAYRRECERVARESAGREGKP